MKKLMMVEPLRGENASRQTKLAVGLLSVVPSLAFFYIGKYLDSVSGAADFAVLLLVFSCAVAAAYSGYLLVRKYSRCILNLRTFVMEVASGELGGGVSLELTDSSDDIKYIEEGFNSVLHEMADRLQIIQTKYLMETELRRKLRQQQILLLKAERHRAMVQSIGAACHHLGQPATALRMRLFMLREHARTGEERSEIEQSIHEVDSICDILQRLREVNAFRTEPYIDAQDPLDRKILAI